MYPEDLFQFVASIAPGTQQVWDCGTGNGQAVALAQHFNIVCASDPSAEQIAHAIPCEGVSYSVQPAESTNYRECSFDAVCVSQALHWFDFPVFFQETKRVLKTRGILGAWGYDWFRVTRAFDATFDKVIMQVIENDWAPQNAILWNGYKDVQIPFTPIKTPKFQIQVSWNLYQLLAYVHTWSSVRRCMARIGRSFFTHAEVALGLHWGSPESVREFIMPLYFLACRYTVTNAQS